MPPDSDSTRLRHMLNAAREAIGYAEGRQRPELDNNRPLQHSLVRCIEIAGEAAARVSDEFKRAHTDIPWAAIVAMRNRLIHAYFDIELDILGRTVESELPPLVRKLEEFLREEPAS